MKRVLVLCLIVAAAAAAKADRKPEELNNGKTIKFFVNGGAKTAARAGSNLTLHSGGTVIRNAHLVCIFWGPSFGSGADATYAAQIQAFRNQFGTTPEYNTITQYYGNDPVSGYGNIAQSNLSGGPADWFDSSAPPTNVTDAIVQSEVKKYITNHGGTGATDYNAIYEVFLPTTSYSSDGTSDSCGGPNLSYCAYHSNYTDASGKNVKYSIQPYPSCSGCQVAGFTNAQNQEHFVCHETREAVTDALGNAWYDRSGNEADDKCAWSPSPFIGTGGYAYQYEWSNANSGCIKTR